MSKEVLQNIIDDFSVDKFQLFFRRKSNKFRFPNEPIYEESENFTDGLKIAEAKFEDGKLIVCAFLSKQDLSERSGKKAQYEIGKKILRHTETDAGIFIFYDTQGSFRFSLIYANYLGRRRDFSNFRRFTYFVSEELTNKTFLQRIGEGDFSTLEKIKDAFSVEPVTKQFYNELQNWYFWAMDEVEFPDDEDKDRENRNAKSLIRLITRIIFVWFMKEKKLVPETLFDKKFLDNILDYKDKTGSTYYKAILQNLFFATLNTPMKKDNPK
ncbi:class I SAM-dependent DNA methyltransferase, partial [bacterium]|nr:class I SAM-dependent DNA methyltransferase [bacterium]